MYKTHYKTKVKITNQENIFNSSFKLHELIQAIGSLKTMKSQGPNSVMAELLKHLGPVALYICLQLCSQIWKTSIPAVWRKAIIIPILKASKLVSELFIYWPIPLTNILAKTGKNGQCKIEPVPRNPKFCHQHKQASGGNVQQTSKLLCLARTFKDTLDRKEMMLVVFVDFRSACDCVWRVQLMDKLQTFGVKGRMLKWIHNFISQCLCATKFVI
jgi:hypothetical protein